MKHILRTAALAATWAVLGGAARAADCNYNGVPDDQDLANGTSADCNGNGVPDECDVDTRELLDDFDGGGPPPGVTRTLSYFWRITDCCAPPPGACDPQGSFAYYGYCTGPFPPFDCTISGTGPASLSYSNLLLPAEPVNAKLSFCYALLTTGDNHEYSTVRVNGTVVEWLNQTALTDPWEPYVIDLAPYAGSTVQLTFHFQHDTIGTLRGWHVDDVRIGNTGAYADCDRDGELDKCEIAADPSLDLDGDEVLDSCQCAVESYCQTAPNSVGPGAVLRHLGTTSLAANDFILRGERAPPGRTGLFFYGPDATRVPFGDGFRCIAAGATGIFRLHPPAAIGPNGTLDRLLDFSAPPASSGPGAIEAGSTWHFQLWYRDPAGGGATFNLSNGLRASFCP